MVYIEIDTCNHKHGSADMIYSVHRNMVSADMVYIEIDTCNHKHGLHDTCPSVNMASADMVYIEIDTCNHTWFT